MIKNVTSKVSESAALLSRILLDVADYFSEVVFFQEVFVLAERLHNPLLINYFFKFCGIAAYLRFVLFHEYSNLLDFVWLWYEVRWQTAVNLGKDCLLINGQFFKILLAL